MNRYEQHTFPTSTASTAISTGARATIDLSSFKNGFVDISCSKACRVRAASAAASLPTAGDMTADFPLSANTIERRFVSADSQHLAVYVATAGTFYWAKSDA